MKQSICTQFKISCVFKEKHVTDAIIQSDVEPRIGEIRHFDGISYEVVDVAQLMPPIDQTGFVQAVFQPIASVSHTS